MIESSVAAGDAAPVGSIRATSLRRLHGIARVLGIGHRAQDITRLFDTMTTPWGMLPPGTLASSDVSADGSPIELAVDMTPGTATLQIAVEAVVAVESDTFAARRAAAESTMDLIATYDDVTVDRWRTISDVFLPDVGGRGPAAMFGAELRPTGPPLLKTWCYPGVTGRSDAVHRVQDALGRLGLAAAWPAVVRHAARGFLLDSPALFSIDLDRRRARTKVYFRHHSTTPSGLARQLAGYLGLSSQTVRMFGHALTDGVGAFDPQPPVTCLTFGPDPAGRPVNTTVYFPLWTYATDDRQVRDVVSGLLRHQGIDPRRYWATLSEVADRSLESALGLHNYLSWQKNDDGSTRIKVYLSPELRAVNPASRYALWEGEVG